MSCWTISLLKILLHTR